MAFLEGRQLITLTNDIGVNQSDLPVKKKSAYFYHKKLFSLCNFDLSLIPIKLNLPMVCKPVEWKSTVVNPTTLAEVRGGYLSQPTGDIYHRYRLLTSHDNSHFFIKLEPDSRHGLLTIMPVINKLQAIPFEIHREGSM